MRRFIGWLFAATLLGATAFAQAAVVFAPPADAGTTLVLRLYGEISDSRATLISHDVAFDSPLRDAAFVVSIDPSVPSLPAPAETVAAVQAPVAVHAVYTAPHFAAFVPRLTRATAQTSLASTLSLGTTSAYQAEPAPAFFDGANTTAFSFSGASSRLIPAFVTQSAFNAQTGADSTLDQNLIVPLAVRIGNLRMLAGFSAGLSSVPTSGVENTLPVFIPTYANVSRSSIGANLAVPVAPRLLVGVGYNTEQIVTGYGMPSELEGLDARNDTYSGNLTFLFPRLSSALSLSAQQYRYQDNLVPAEYTQLREDVNLTVKF